MADAATLRARLAALEAAETSVLTGERILKVSYDGGSVEYAAPASLADIKRAIFETRSQLARALGQRGQGGAIVPVFVG